MNSIGMNSILLGKSCLLLSVLSYLLCYKVQLKNACCCSICNAYEHVHTLIIWSIEDVALLTTKQQICWHMAHLSVPADQLPTA